MSTEEQKALDVWLRIPEGEEEAEAEANTFVWLGVYHVEWYLTAVGLVKTQWFHTHEAARAWLTAEGFEDYSSGETA
jgi:hypothetical protein